MLMGRTATLSGFMSIAPKQPTTFSAIINAKRGGSGE
jgi:hypothetical protein